ncbi:hypothetical protein NL676_000178 [Syzygium grande]|nr:hypothetical protein NL676_000178 [Syzygium grande]
MRSQPSDQVGPGARARGARDLDFKLPVAAEAEETGGRHVEPGLTEKPARRENLRVLAFCFPERRRDRNDRDVRLRGFRILCGSDAACGRGWRSRDAPLDLTRLVRLDRRRRRTAAVVACVPGRGRARATLALSVFSATAMATHPSLLPEIGPDGLPREAPVIAYTEKIIEEEQLQLKKYIEENYSKIRDVERELASLSMEMKLTAGPKKAALEHLRKKIEASTERIRVAKLKEEEARKVWEVASKALKDEEAVKQKLCDDLSNLVQESSTSQFNRLEELKRRLSALNPSRTSVSSPQAALSGTGADAPALSVPHASGAGQAVDNSTDQGNSGNGPSQQPSADGGEERGRKKVQFHGRGKGIGAVPNKGRGHPGTGWTGAGFDVDGRT